jgi:hypothetical protein
MDIFYFKKQNKFSFGLISIYVGTEWMYMSDIILCKLHMTYLFRHDKKIRLCLFSPERLENCYQLIIFTFSAIVRSVI